MRSQSNYRLQVFRCLCLTSRVIFQALRKKVLQTKKLKNVRRRLALVFSSSSFPVELYSLSGKSGSQMRATVTEFGPVLLSKILELNDTQTGVLNIPFKYADDKNLGGR